ncbi:MAG: DUF559 domain-containing protein [Spirochaetaceae bacterium]|nr:DUF559 domain-containing protein [Spirochaetaceae bacterium]
MDIRPFIEPSPPAPLPQGEGSEKTYINYRGGFSYAGLVEIAGELRKEETAAEKMTWHLLRNRRFRGLKFRRHERRDSQPRTM